MPIPAAVALRDLVNAVTTGPTFDWMDFDQHASDLPKNRSYDPGSRTRCRGSRGSRASAGTRT